MATTNDVAIIGMHGRFPGADGVSDLWRLVRAGEEAITEPTEAELLESGIAADALEDPSFVASGRVLSDIDRFDAAFFGYSPYEAARTDPQQRLFLETCWQALESAGYGPRTFDGHAGVFGGVDMNTYLLFHLRDELDSARTVGDFGTVIGNDKDYLATRVSYKLGLSGPSVTVQTACSTSLVAVHLACQSLIDQQCDVALAGGASVTVPQAGYFFRDDGILSPDGRCRPFVKDAAGTVFGNGVGVVVLKLLEDAVRDGDTVWAVIKGSAVNNDGQRKVGYTAPSVDGQVDVISEALAVSDVDPESIGYLEAHGTATPVGDAIEVTALHQVFGTDPGRRRSCALGSVKANLGHLGSAAGVAGLIKVALALRHAELPPHPAGAESHPELELERGPFRLLDAAEPWPVGHGTRRAAVSSFGIGGTNAHLVVEQAPAVQPVDAAPGWRLLPLSARSAPDLHRLAGHLAADLAAPDAPPLRDVAHTLRQRRGDLGHRRVLVCRDTGEAADILADRATGLGSLGTVGDGEPRVVFLLPGGGAQHPGMTRELYREVPVYRAALDECAGLFAEHLGDDFRRPLFADAADERAAGELLEATIGLPALFSVEYALASSWRELGVEPAALLGHSLGECVAALLAGVVDLPDAVRLVAARTQALRRARGGAMLRVQLPERDVVELLADECDLAVVNEVDSVVVSGESGAIDRLARRLEERGAEASTLHLRTAAHSRLLDPWLGDFAAAVRGITLREPRIPFVSNLTGRWIEPAQATDPDYWVRQFRGTARFHDGVGAVLDITGAVHIELGPAATLSGLVRRHPAAPRGLATLGCLPGPKDDTSDHATYLSAVGGAWSRGVGVDWDRLPREPGARRVPLSPYPFAGARHWIPAVTPGSSRTAAERPQEPDEHEQAEQAGREGIPTLYAEPVTDLERTVAGVWEDMLSYRPIGRLDRFFDLGGDSLIATRVLARLRARFQVRLPLRRLFADPTVAGVAAALDALLVEHVESLSEADAEELLSRIGVLAGEERGA